MLLLERGLIRLGDPVAKHIPDFAQNGKANITVEQLLTHHAGLIPDNPLADYEDGPELAWKRIWKLKPIEPPGSKFIYTDVGFLTLGKLVEQISGTNLDSFARENIFEPLRMQETGYLPPPELRARAIATERREGRWMKGEVHDPRAYLLGGVAGHAGLFSTANDMALFAQALLRTIRNQERAIISPLTLEQMLLPRDVSGHLRGLGWDKRSRYSSNRGELFSKQAAGHGGFTGQAFWLDPELDLFVIFLSTRLHPDGKGNINPLAGRIGTIAAAALRQTQEREPSAPKQLPATHQTLTGIDVLKSDHFTLLSGNRVGLITNHTGLSREGQSTIDLLRNAPEVDFGSVVQPRAWSRRTAGPTRNR